jgi:hypothetical protein
LTEALMPHLPDGANVVFVCSGVEDLERKPAVAAGFRGGRYISAEASARGEWKPGGSALPGGDAYATSKQCNLATVMAFARETPRLRFNAVEPAFSPATSLSRDANVLLRFLGKYVLSLLAPFIKYWSTPARAAKVITNALLNESGGTGVYYDDRGQPMLGSTLVRDPKFQDRVVAETRARRSWPEARGLGRAGLAVRIMVCGLIQCPAGAHDRQWIERVTDHMPHDGARDRARKEDSHADGLPHRTYVFSGQSGTDHPLAQIVEIRPPEGLGERRMSPLVRS